MNVDSHFIRWARQTGLTRRQAEVFCLLARGTTPRTIARLLNRSPRTIETHIRNGLLRIGASTPANVVYAVFYWGMHDGDGR